MYLSLTFARSHEWAIVETLKVARPLMTVHVNAERRTIYFLYSLIYPDLSLILIAIAIHIFVLYRFGNMLCENHFILRNYFWQWEVLILHIFP